MSSSWHSRLKALLGPNLAPQDEGAGDEQGQLAKSSTTSFVSPQALSEAPLQESRGIPSEMVSADSTLSPEPLSRTAPLREAGEPVLIVDDDRDWCLECSFSLRQLGYEPLVAYNTADALAAFLEHDVSIAIVDYNLPEGNGITLIHELTQKAEEQGRTLSFIMATGYATKDIAIGAMRAAVTDFLEKPITQGQLRDALQRIKGLRPSMPGRDALLDKISSLGAELQRLAMLMDSPDPSPVTHQTAPIESDGGDLDTAQLKAFIRDQLSREAKRRAIGGGELFGDPTWAMLLDLLLAKIEGRRISVSSACIASGAPMSTALRLVRRLVGEEVLCRLPDAHDRRRHFLAINPKFEQPLLEYVADQAQFNKG